MRWNSAEDWVYSDRLIHEPIIDKATFHRARTQAASGSRSVTTKVKRARHHYLLRGIIYCKDCGRRMQGSWNNNSPHYRCRYPDEYASKKGTDHARNVYIRQDSIEPLLDEWLGRVFNPDNIRETCASLAALAEAETDDQGTERVAAEREIRQYDARLNKYRQLLDEGGDPKIVAQWMCEVQSDRKAAEQKLALLQPQQTITSEDIRRMIDAVEDKLRLLSEADTEAKAALYSALGIRLTFDHRQRVVTVESEPDVWASTGLTDIHHQGHSPREDVQNGDHGEEEAASAALVHSGVQG